jgi:hypothetical protein
VIMSIQPHSKVSSGVRDEVSYGAMPRDYRHAFRAAVGTSEMRNVEFCKLEAGAVDDPPHRLSGFLLPYNRLPPSNF